MYHSLFEFEKVKTFIYVENITALCPSLFVSEIYFFCFLFLFNAIIIFSGESRAVKPGPLCQSPYWQNCDCRRQDRFSAFCLCQEAPDQKTCMEACSGITGPENLTTDCVCACIPDSGGCKCARQCNVKIFSGLCKNRTLEERCYAQCTG